MNDDLEKMIREAEEQLRAAKREVELLEKREVEAERIQQAAHHHMIKAVELVAQDQITDEAQNAKWAADIASLRQRMDQLRRSKP